MAIIDIVEGDIAQLAIGHPTRQRGPGGRAPGPAMNLTIAPYEDQRRVWPSSGRHIKAQCDDATVVVYQAFRSSIAKYAVVAR